MADNEEGEGPTPRGNEWEVVSLTASAYAAAPGSEEVEVKDDAETSRAMFMSGHFVFPPNQHENLPLEPETDEIYDDEHGAEDAGPEMNVEEGSVSVEKVEGKFLENWNIKGDEFPGIQFLDEKGNQLGIPDTDFEEGTDKEQNIYTSFHSETTIAESTAYNENPELIELPDHDVEFDVDISESQTHTKEEDSDESDLPCGTWWKKRAASLYAHAKDANALWSIFIAAAVMGLVILGQQWQQERWQVLQHRWQFSVDQKTSKMLGPLSRFKDVIVGGNRRGSFIRNGASNDH